MNPRTRADVMTLAPEHDTSHPFLYARILGIFHVDVVHNIPGATTVPTSIEVLWAHRFRIDTSYRAGFKAKRLHRLQFIPGDDPLAFDLLNPDEVIRGVHLIPAFAHGRTHDLLQRSISPEDDEEWFEEPDDDSAGWRSIALENEKNHEDGEWRYHYVNIFVDRDMYVRYVGGGVGHYKVEIGEEPDLELPEEGADAADEADGLERELDEQPTAQSPSLADGDEEPIVNDSGSDSSRSDGEGAEEPSSEEDSVVDGADDSDDDLGPEDGEGFVNEEDEEGYASL
ncbi:hypothetical protein K438DRAFT_1735667 [Mycena galopus ATCC 62051]|nr:hypothetical protein K438DRAFT_1735667 [Mycena galopus ATCC 62051]